MRALSKGILSFVFFFSGYIALRLEKTYILAEGWHLTICLALENDNNFGFELI